MLAFIFKKEHPPERVIFIISILWASIYNVPLWKKLLTITPVTDMYSFIVMLGLFLFLIAFLSLTLLLLPFRYIGRMLISVVFLLSSLAVYFMNNYGILIDVGMVQNVFETDFAEVADLLTFKMLVYFVVLGIFPVVLLWKHTTHVVAFGIAFKRRFLAISIPLVVIVIIAATLYQSFAPLFRNNRDLRYVVIPNNYINGLRGYAQDMAKETIAVKPIGTDAKKGSSWANKTRKTLVVLVVGETARSANFSLNGYSRDTNPLLKAQADIISFSQVQSCGTQTAVSLPCMFSSLGRSDYSPQLARSQEGMLDVVQHAGLNVLWMDNQSGCKGVCDRVKNISVSTSATKPFCDSEGCQDGIFIEKIKEYSQEMTQDSLVVLHQMGSHGPAYYLRYPPEFERFTPTCKTKQLDSCAKEQIRNTYDNTILYTDHVIANLITELGAQRDIDTALIYISDHGESLGEYNMFLHGAPFILAPDYQKHIPQIVWLSENFRHAAHINNDCLKQKKAEPLSHDNLIHSILGLLDIDTTVYRRELDIFYGCR